MVFQALPGSSVRVSRVAYGCMYLGPRWNRDPVTPEDTHTAARIIETVLETGINLFDHADIYAFGKSEIVFGEYIRTHPEVRKDIILLSKCGIRRPGEPHSTDPQRYDFSYAYIMQSVDAILKRLHTDYLDILLLHRPDVLVEPDEVARAFSELHASGKVRHFGVSNHNVGQIALLQRSVDQKLMINQLEFSLAHPALADDGVLVNRTGIPYTSSTSILDFCRLENILVQAWAPLKGGALMQPAHDAPESWKAVAGRLRDMAAEKGVAPEALAIAWILRHPAGIQPIFGSTNPDRIRRTIPPDDLVLSREEWYSLYLTARGYPLP